MIDAIAAVPHPTLGNWELAARLGLAVALDGDVVYAQVKTLDHADVTALVAPLADRPEVVSVDVD